MACIYISSYVRAISATSHDMRHGFGNIVWYACLHYMHKTNFVYSTPDIVLVSVDVVGMDTMYTIQSTSNIC